MEKELKNLQNLKEIIEFLISKQLSSANEKFPPFNSRHEAWAVIHEEVEELDNELADTKRGLTHYWTSIKKDADTDILVYVYNSLICALNELSQVAAMVKKAMVLERGINESTNDSK